MRTGCNPSIPVTPVGARHCEQRRQTLLFPRCMNPGLSIERNRAVFAKGPLDCTQLCRIGQVVFDRHTPFGAEYPCQRCGAGGDSDPIPRQGGHSRTIGNLSPEHSLHKNGDSLHFAKAVKFFIENDFVTGETIDVNGGLFMR